ncbi:selenocysteine synthase [Gallibacterium salpingitidis]|uniref:L-seryl-tRNA(Sec) selenium transferase n=1 Tax=Gallibacterium salpingitidis TaxID=505341 RepID=A0A1A7P5C4_9PAST|nr:L-seryl-tRNA(Sec) selenium transferase [Gallibacterium salpingitidis]OBW96419.1 selenocysteine synthase [Gallibacterium salpingitidis]OBX06488.1 selenocysteine synthase [Gallibacterium salpingitidis]WKS99431.1 L-seryl-tRNA(Sec) selenium transferase [Gallibacterium salpingitidis]
MSALYRQLPAIDRLLKTEFGTQLLATFGHIATVNMMRIQLEKAREQIKQHQQLPDYCQTEQSFLQHIQQQLQQQRQVNIQPVHNLTGTVLHTNLGRAIWSEAAQQAAVNAMRQNVALEFDLQQGKRGHRDQAISELIARLTGAEAACVVNNNAAAVLLMLATFAQGKEVIISRGELIEIGGAFRIPDIMAQAGCKLVEVGTTNRTHLRDYAQAINENTALLLKVHSSNYQIVGFTTSVSEEELVQLGKEKGIPVITDLGSGALIDFREYGLPYEPQVQQKVAAGVDLISFSGDKLLGGPQAGIIVGKQEWIDQLQRHPLKRVLRCDKVILSGLEATLRLYLEPENLAQSLPTLNALTADLTQLTENAQQLQQALQQKLAERFEIAINNSDAQIGSGSQPTAKIPSIAVTLQPKSTKSEDLYQLVTQLKTLSQPIIGRIEADKLWLDLRSVADIEALLTTVNEL